jgi:ketosteroid isomerase-like protein
MLVLKIVGNVDSNNDDVKKIRKQIVQWQQLFSPGEEQYSLNGYEHLYSQRDNELLIYDNYADKDTRWTGFDRYREIWEREINSNFPGFMMYRIEIDRIETSGDLAWSALTWWGSVVKDGKSFYPAQHATHIWRKVDDEWRIIHEHLTSGVKEDGKESRRPEHTDETNEHTFYHQR